MTEALDYPSKTQLVHLDWHFNDSVLGNPSATARKNYYGTTAAPDVWFDGTQHVLGAGDSVSAYNQYKPIFASHYTDPSQLLVSVDLTLDGGSLTGTATANVEVAPGETITNPSACKIRIALYENYCAIPTPPGEPHTALSTQSYIGRLMISETTLTASTSGQTQQVVSNFAINGTWKIGDLHAVAFVQRDTNKAVLQAGFSPVQFAVTLADLDPPVQQVNAGTGDFDSQVIYQGTIDDDVTVNLDKTGLPVGWDAVVVWNSTSYPSGFTIPGMTMDQMEALTVRVTPSGPGMGSVKLTVFPASFPSASQVRTYYMFYQRPRILFVDDDNGSPFQSYFQSAITSAGYFALTHTLATQGSPAASWMSNFEVVVWNTGDLQALTLTTANQNDLISYLNAGGKLYLVSQGFLNDRGLAPITTGYLRVNAFTPDIGAPNVVGLAADPIGDGLNFAVGGAPFVEHADAMTSSTGGVGWLDAGANHVAMHYDSGTFKTVFQTTPLEDLTAPDAALVMQRVIQWLAPNTLTDAPTVGPAIAGGITLYQNAPNPFADGTSVRFAIPTSGHVGLSVYDVAGRRVTSLVDRRLEAGVHSVDWDGRDASGARVASGVYLLRLNAAGETTSREMVRVK